MAFEAYLKIDGIAGNATDHKHKDWIEVQSFSWGENNTGVASHGAGGGAGKVHMQDLQFVKQMDKSSPKLFLACANGHHHKDVTFNLCRTNKERDNFMIFKMHDVIVSSYHPGGSAEGTAGLPLENVTLNFSKVEFTFTPMDHHGKAQGAVHAHWDLKTNKGG